jgi:hypothetical protein
MEGLPLGKLVTFEKRRIERKEPGTKPAQAEAEIVLFTGIRYERGSGEPGKPPASAGPKRKRG